MKNLLLFILLSAFFVSVPAQNKARIQLHIEKINDGDFTWIKLTLTNKGEKPIMINNMCRISNSGTEIGKSDSYATASAYDNNNNLVGFSNKLNFVSFNANNGVNLKKGDSEIQVFLLKTDEIQGFFGTSFSEDNIKYLELKVHLSYFVFIPNGISKSTQDLVSNRIFM